MYCVAMMNLTMGAIVCDGLRFAFDKYLRDASECQIRVIYGLDVKGNLHLSREAN